MKKTIFVALMLSASNVLAFTLGDAEVVSTSPSFKAAIPVFELEEDNQSTLGGRVRSFSTYSDTLQFSVSRASAGHLEFVLTSTKPLNEDLALEVELTYGAKTATRDYLLMPLSIDTAGERTPEKLVAEVQPRNQRVERVQTFDLSLTHTTHTVKANQSLYDIAVDCKEIGGNVYQRAIAIFAANKQTFTRGDINRLEEGMALYIPQQSYVAGFDPDSARSMFFDLANGNMDIDVAQPTGVLAVAKPQPATPNVSEVESQSAAIPALSASAESVDFLRNRVDALETKIDDLNRDSEALHDKVDVLSRQLQQLLEKTL